MSIITDEMVEAARRAFSAAFVAAGGGQCALTAALAALARLQEPGMIRRSGLLARRNKKGW